MSWNGVILVLCGVTLFLLCVGLLLVRTCLMVVTVQGQSMLPTLKPGDRVLALRLFRVRRLQKSQIILFWQMHPDQIDEILPLSLHVKRVAALAGETYVSSSPPCWEPERTPHKQAGTPYTWRIPQDHLFVCGDNREQSIDSRSWGPLPLRNVRGVVVMKLSRPSASSHSSV